MLSKAYGNRLPLLKVLATRGGGGGLDGLGLFISPYLIESLKNNVYNIFHLHQSILLLCMGSRR